MDFKTILGSLPSIDHLQGLDVISNGNVIHHIPAIQGKLGSLRVYHALAQQFNGKLDRTCAEKGLQLFAEHTEDAKQNPGKHPNIDLLLRVIAENLEYQLIAKG
ncbi:DUF2322 family protein [[Pasteurella] aerogenes]|nr:DUF2322 family protein [[Pasteurella] aerogenes]MCU9998197.1 DUF2322 family protein [[Pasteurella] aerogenes]VEG71873.1 Uncharacterized protein conserved in bacteria [[Pasteurella] aerogenes]